MLLDTTFSIVNNEDLQPLSLTDRFLYSLEISNSIARHKIIRKRNMSM